MKKFLAVFFSVLFALSATTVAFADAANLTCDVCKEVLGSEKDYTAHVSGGCLRQFKACSYCEAKVRFADAEGNDVDDLKKHELACPKGAGTCEFCGEDYATQADYTAHKENDCKVTGAIGDKVPVATIFDKVVEAVKGVDWGSLIGKIGDLLGGIDFEGLIAKIKPILEKVIEFVKGAIA